MNEFIVTIRWEPNESYTTALPYLPRKGDMLKIFDDPDNNQEEAVLAKGEVKKVVYFENIDTREHNEPNFDIYINQEK